MRFKVNSCKLISLLAHVEKLVKPVNFFALPRIAKQLNNRLENASESRHRIGTKTAKDIDLQILVYCLILGDKRCTMNDSIRHQSVCFMQLCGKYIHINARKTT